MNKRILGIGLTILTILLWVGPIAAAFASHGWSVKETVMPEEEQINDIEDKVDNLIGGKELSSNNFSVIESDIVGEKVDLTIEFTSPFLFSLKIVKFRTSLFDDSRDITIANVEMVESSIETESEGTVTFSLEGTLTDEAKEYTKIPDQLSFSEGIFKFIASEISVSIDFKEVSESGGN